MQGFLTQLDALRAARGGSPPDEVDYMAGPDYETGVEGWRRKLERALPEAAWSLMDAFEAELRKELRPPTAISRDELVRICLESIAELDVAMRDFEEPDYNPRIHDEHYMERVVRSVLGIADQLVGLNRGGSPAGEPPEVVYQLGLTREQFDQIVAAEIAFRLRMAATALRAGPAPSAPPPDHEDFAALRSRGFAATRRSLENRAAPATEAALRELVSALDVLWRDFAFHDDDCPGSTRDAHDECTCGLTPAMARISKARAALAGAPPEESPPNCTCDYCVARRAPASPPGGSQEATDG